MRVRQQDRRHDERGGDERGERRAAARGAGRNRPGSTARRRASASRRWRRTNRPSASARSKPPSTTIVSSSASGVGPRGVRVGAGERERRGDRVAGAALGVDRERRLAQRRAGADDERRAARAARATGIAAATSGRLLERQEPLGDREHELRDRDDGERRTQNAPDGAPEPQPAAMRGERRRGARRAPGRARRPSAAGSAGTNGDRRRRRAVGRPGRGARNRGIRLHLRAGRWPGRRGGGCASAGSARRAGRTGRSGRAPTIVIARDAPRPVAVAGDPEAAVDRRRRRRWPGVGDARR